MKTLITLLVLLFTTTANAQGVDIHRPAELMIVAGERDDVSMFLTDDYRASARVIMEDITIVLKDEANNSIMLGYCEDIIYDHTCMIDHGECYLNTVAQSVSYLKCYSDGFMNHSFEATTSLVSIVMMDDLCEGDFDCDGDVDGSDALLFKIDFGRNQFSENPCP